MLPRQPLRFLLADDPGAGKTIMAGLLIKELLIRGDLERCLIVAPGGLVEQWQDEMAEKFGLAFDILSRDQIETSRTGNPFTERSRLIVRLDMAARSDELQAKIDASPEWDLVICDEAHRMAASYFSGEIKETRRYKLGKLLGTRTRNLLLMSATPHNGKEADFQLFMGLLDADRFEGRFREGVHKADVSDMMRRLSLCTHTDFWHVSELPSTISVLGMTPATEAPGRPRGGAGERRTAVLSLLATGLGRS
jgi:superfamily II DNA or RNA helicase